MYEKFIQTSPWRAGGATTGSSCCCCCFQTQQTHCSPPPDVNRVAVVLTSLLEAGVACRVATVTMALVRQLLVCQASAQTATSPLQCDASTQHGALQLDAEHQRVAYTNLLECYSKQTAHCMKRSFRRVLSELVQPQLAVATAATAFKLSKRIAAYQQISTG